MKIELGEKGLMIVPETEFEREFLQRLRVVSAFHKTGQSPADYVGLKLVVPNLVFKQDG